MGTINKYIIDDEDNYIEINITRSLIPTDNEPLLAWMHLKHLHWELHDTAQGAYLLTPDKRKVTLQRIKGFLYLPISDVPSSKKSMTLLQLHEAMNHPIATPCELKKRGERMNIKILTNEYDCTQCTLNNVHHKKVRTFSLSRSLILLHRCFIDLFGPFAKSTKGNRFGLQLVDDACRVGEVTFIKRRDEKHIAYTLPLKLTICENQDCL